MFSSEKAPDYPEYKIKLAPFHPDDKPGTILNSFAKAMRAIAYTKLDTLNLLIRNYPDLKADDSRFL